MTDPIQTIDLLFETQNEAAIVNPADGEFIAISRLALNREFLPGQPLKFEIIRTLDAAQFYALLGETSPGPISIGDLSDHLVRAFDLGELNDRMGGNCMFVWRNAAGLMVQQHST